MKGVVYAGLTRPDGSVLAEQGSGLRLADDIDLDDGGFSPFQLLFVYTAKVSVPVVENTRVVGRVTLIANASELADRLLGVVRNGLLAAALAMAVGFAVAWRLGRTLTRPLTALAPPWMRCGRTTITAAGPRSLRSPTTRSAGWPPASTGSSTRCASATTACSTTRPGWSRR